MIDTRDPDACDCTKVQQDETCPVGWPSLLCDDCDGIGLKSARGFHKRVLARLDRMSSHKECET